MSSSGTTMSTGRLEAFSDGVIAILITIMVLEFKIPHESGLAALVPLCPVFLAYVLSFANIGIYWNNHHHMLHVTETINGSILWANLHLLFWLSLNPFVTGWMGENHFAAVPTAIYGVVQFGSGVAYVILQAAIVRQQGAHSRLRRALGRDVKGKLSAALYLLAVPLTFVREWLAAGIYVIVSLMWLIPDRRIERMTHE